VTAAPRIRLQGITKRYGAQLAADDVSFDVSAGTVLGLLGRNGAGKTTTLSCALGLIAPTAGVALFDGKPLDPTMLQRVAYIPETPALYGWMTLEQHIEMRRRLYPKFDPSRARALAESFDLNPRKSIRRLSKGGHTSAALSLAFAQNADMFFLDEPASGLDPYAQRILLDTIVRASADGAAIVFSSHDISHVERVAEEIAIIDRGRLIVHENLDALRDSHKIVEAVFAQIPAALDLAMYPSVTRIDIEGSLVRAHVASDAETVATDLTSRGAHAARIIDRTLEDFFLAATTERTR
jgi:ABC-2 type transport system ATP-binding protein